MHHRVGVTWYTQSILERNKHWSKAPTASSTFMHRHSYTSVRLWEKNIQYRYQTSASKHLNPF